MKLIKKLSPKRLFDSMKARSTTVSRSEPSSFSSGATTSSSDEESSSVRKARSTGTPVSVLPQMSGDWSDGSSHATSLELYQAFKLIDRDNDGAISRAELEALLNRIGGEPISQDETAVMLREVGCDDADSCLNIEDLLGRVGAVSGPACDSELRETFDFFDTDHDGRITAEELMRVFTALGDDGCTLEDCRRMIADVDKNRDGFVCFEDFARMMELQI